MQGHRRHLFQFSLRTFMILLTGGCIWLGWKVERARRQQAVIRLATETGGNVLFDSEERPIVVGKAIRYPNLFATLGNEPPVMAKWLRPFLGDGFFFNHSVVAVRLSGQKVKNADLELLSHLPSLHTPFACLSDNKVEENPYRSPHSAPGYDADADCRVRTVQMSSAIALACLIVVVILVGIGIDGISSGDIPLVFWCIINSTTWSLTAWAVWKNGKPTVVLALSLDVVAFFSGFCFFPANR